MIRLSHRIESVFFALIIVCSVVLVITRCDLPTMYVEPDTTSEESEGIEFIEQDTLVVPTIIAADFNFPVMKNIGDGVSYYPSISVSSSSDCGEPNIQQTDYYGIEISSINSESVTFTIIDTVWYWEYVACCQFNSSVCDTGFIIGQAQ